jgi:hypothetical protein
MSEYVYAVEVRAGDPQFLASDEEELAGMDGAIIGLEQCDACGNACYRIDVETLPSVRGDRAVLRRAAVVCVTDEDGHIYGVPGDEAPTGCGTRYAVEYLESDHVVF